MPFNALRHVPLFSDLTEGELKIMVTLGIRRKYPAQNILFQEGEPGDSILVILSGKVKVLLTGKGGQEFILSLLGPGSFFGEMAVLEAAPRSATVITVEPSEFFQFGRQEFGELLQRHSSIVLKILKHLSQRLRRTNEQIRSLVMFDIYGRVGRCLINLAEKQEGRANGQLMVPNRPSLEELAKMIGCSRETLSRALKVLRENGCLTMTRNAIYIQKGWQ